MNRTEAEIPDSHGKRRLLRNLSRTDELSMEELKEILRYTARLAELYEMYILEKGIQYIWEADEFIERNKGEEFPLL